MEQRKIIITVIVFLKFGRKELERKRKSHLYFSFILRKNGDSLIYQSKEPRSGLRFTSATHNWHVRSRCTPSLYLETMKICLVLSLVSNPLLLQPQKIHLHGKQTKKIVPTEKKFSSIRWVPPYCWSDRNFFRETAIFRKNTILKCFLA